MGNKNNKENVDWKMSSRELMYLAVLVGFLVLTLGVISRTMAG